MIEIYSLFVLLPIFTSTLDKLKKKEANILSSKEWLRKELAINGRGIVSQETTLCCNKFL